MPVMWRRIVLFLSCLIPFAWLVTQLLTNQLGADPAKTIVLATGKWTMYFLLLTLAVTPLRRLLNFRWLQVHRRMLGLFTLFYALVHVIAYWLFILGGDVSKFGAELVKRPYIVVAIPALILLILLGATSTQAMMRLFGKNWIRLHRSIYLIAALAWLHVLWQLRSNYFDVLTFGIIIVFLLGIRGYWLLLKNPPRQPKA